MLNNLLESDALPERSLSGHAFSLALHAAGIALAVIATSGVVTGAPPVPTERTTFVAPPVDVPKPPAPRPPDATVTPPTVKGYQVLIAPIDIPDVLPDIDLSRPITEAADYVRVGVPGGTANGTPTGVARAVGDDRSYFAAEVEQPAILRAGTSQPVYPSTLQAAGIKGAVSISFVIDTTGRADMSSLRIVKSTHVQFTEAVRRSLPDMRFLPAKIGGKNVRQLVEMPFAFTIR